MNTGTFGVAPQDAGVASATLNTGQQIGGSIGTSLLNTIFASAVAHYLARHLSPAALVHGHPAPSLIGMSLIHGYTTGFWVAAAIFGAGAVICGTLFRFGPLRAAAGAHSRRGNRATGQPGTGHPHPTPGPGAVRSAPGQIWRSQSCGGREGDRPGSGVPGGQTRPTPACEDP